MSAIRFQRVLSEKTDRTKIRSSGSSIGSNNFGLSDTRDSTGFPVRLIELFTVARAGYSRRAPLVTFVMRKKLTRADESEITLLLG